MKRVVTIPCVIRIRYDEEEDDVYTDQQAYDYAVAYLQHITTPDTLTISNPKEWSITHA